MNGNNKSFDQKKGKKRPAGARPAFDKKNSGEADVQISENAVIGRNSVRELLRSGREIDKIFVQRGEREGSIIPIIAEAKKLGFKHAIAPATIRDKFVTPVKDLRETLIKYVK